LTLMGRLRGALAPLLLSPPLLLKERGIKGVRLINIGPILAWLIPLFGTS